MSMKSLCNINYSSKLKELTRTGSDLFEDWNYYLFLSSLVVMYVTIHIYFYLAGLTFLHTNMIENLAEYKGFLHKVYGAGILFAAIFALTYMYAMLSHMYYSVTVSQRANVDALLINLFYFVLLCSSLKYNGYDEEVVLYFFLLALVPIIVAFYFIYKKINLKIKSKKNIFKRVLQILLLSFLVENFSYIFLSYQLASIDMKDKLVQKTLIKADEEKKKILKKISNISNKKLLMYKDNTHSIHIVVAN